MDSPTIEAIKAIAAPILSGGGAFGFYLLYRKFEAEARASLREDNKTLREENEKLRKELNARMGLQTTDEDE